MREKFRKIMSVVGSALLVGSTIGFAMAAGGSFPAPFVESNTPDYAIVVGAGAAASDTIGANSINTYLNTFYSVETSDTSDTSTYTGDFSDSVGVTEDEVALGESITGPLKISYTDNKISTLLDTEVSWDDGVDSKNYDLHEEINLVNNGLVLKTTLDDDELENDVVLENSKALEYKFVFDDALNTSRIGTEDANSLFLTILGKEYEILDMDDNSITVSFSDEKVVKTGDNVISGGVTLSIGDIFENTIEVNGVFINEGRTKKVNGIEVYVDTIAYHPTTSLPSKAIIKVGKDISQKIKDGDEYINDDETWVWDIETPGKVNGHIGVKYDIKSVSYDEDEEEENAITIGQSYALPENYGAIVFEGLTNVDYEDFELSFDDRDLYSGVGSIKQNNVDVAILEGENDDSITLSNGSMNVETDSIYLKYINENFSELYFKDIDGDIDDDYEGRIQLFSNVTDVKIVVGDNELVVDYVPENGTLTLTNGEVINITLGNNGTIFDGLGDEENAESDDVIVDSTNVGTREDDVFTNTGVYVRDPESNAESDRVVLSIPSEQIYARISVKGQGMTVESDDVNVEGNETVVVPEVGGLVITDAEVGTHTDKNLIIVGGSCINAEAARLLGGKACGEEFTLKTGVIAGQYIIKTFDDAGRIAVVVAGYNAEDTTRGVADFIASETDFSVVGAKVIA